MNVFSDFVKLAFKGLKVKPLTPTIFNANLITQYTQRKTFQLH